MTMRRLLLILVLPLAACSFFSRTKSRIFSLERIAPASRVSVAGAPIAIAAIELPPGLDRKEIVVRKADLQWDVRGTDQWSATLEDLVLHTLAFDLADRLPEGAVILPGQAKPAGAIRNVSVVFEELSAGPDNVFVLDARWNMNHEHITVEMQSLESAEVASAMSKALGLLADRIAVWSAATPVAALTPNGSESGDWRRRSPDLQ